MFVAIIRGQMQQFLKGTLQAAAEISTFMLYWGAILFLSEVGRDLINLCLGKLLFIVESL